MSEGAPYCLSCRRIRPGSQTSPTCDAFPGGVPTPILAYEADHRKPYAGDHGIRFAQDPAKPRPPWRALGLPENGDE